MATPISPIPNLSQYNYEIGDTTEVVTKQNGVNAEIDALVPAINAAIDEINQDVDDVNNAAANLNVEQIVHAPGSGLPNQAGSAYSKNVTTTATDATQGRVLKVGDGGVLSGNAPPSGNASALRNGGFYDVDTNAAGFPQSSSLLFAARRAAGLGVNRVAEIFIAANSPNPTPRIAFRGGDPVAAEFTEIYHQKNIVGGVSLVSGIPSGALFEYDSNSIGDWEKLPDGIMNMWCEKAFTGVDVLIQEGSLFRSAEMEVPLPLAGAAGQSVSFSVNLQSGSGALLSVSIARTRRSGNSVFFSLTKGVSETNLAFSVVVQAKTRWY